MALYGLEGWFSSKIAYRMLINNFYLKSYIPNFSYEVPLSLPRSIIQSHTSPDTYCVSKSFHGFGAIFGHFWWFSRKNWKMTIFTDFHRKKSPSKICFRYQPLYVKCTIWPQRLLCKRLWCPCTRCVHNRHICHIYELGSEAETIYMTKFWKFHLWFDKTKKFLFFQKILRKIVNIFSSHQNRLDRKKVITI